MSDSADQLFGIPKRLFRVLGERDAVSWKFFIVSVILTKS